MPVLTNTGRRVGGYIIGESAGADGPYYSRESVTLAEGADYVPGMVLARHLVGDAISAVKSGGNTGTGTLVLDAIPILSGAESGTYQVRFVAPGEFRVTDPDGRISGVYGIGGDDEDEATVDRHVKFTLTQGATAFVIGDGFDVTVTGVVKYSPLTSGEQPAAICFGAYDAAEADVTGVVNVRHTTVNGHELVWPEGYTDDQIKGAAAKLAELGIVVRY